MMINRKAIGIVIVSAFQLALVERALPIGPENILPLVPYPQRVEMAEGYYSLGEKVALRAPPGTEAAVEVLRSVLQENGIALVDDAEDKLQRIDLILDEKLPEATQIGQQGYVLEVKPPAISIRALTGQGLFYGAATLAQIVQDVMRAKKIPCLKITDWPDIEMRGILFDTRGYRIHVEFFKRIIDTLAFYKMNFLVVYTQDIYQFKKFCFGSHEATDDKFREISAYAKARFVQVIPQINSLAHVDTITARFPQIRLQIPGCSAGINPLAPETPPVFAEIYAEIIKAFPETAYFHVGLDEVFWGDVAKAQKYPAVTEFVKTKGTFALYKTHLLNLREILQKHNRKLMLWGDSIKAHGKELDDLPKDLIPYYWKYAHCSCDMPTPEKLCDEFIKGLGDLESAGFKEIYIAPAGNCYQHFDSNLIDRFYNIRYLTRAGVKRRVKGTCVCVWEIGGSFDQFDLYWLTLLYAGECAWSNQTDDPEDFQRRWAVSFFGVADEKYQAILRQARWFFCTQKVAPAFLMRAWNNGVVLQRNLLGEIKTLQEDYIASQVRPDQVGFYKDLPRQARAFLEQVQDLPAKIAAVRQRVRRNRFVLEQMEFLADNYIFLAIKIIEIDRAARAYAEAYAVRERQPAEAEKKLKEVKEALREIIAAGAYINPASAELDKKCASGRIQTKGHDYKLEKLIAELEQVGGDLSKLKTPQEFGFMPPPTP